MHFFKKKMQFLSFDEVSFAWNYVLFFRNPLAKSYNSYNSSTRIANEWIPTKHEIKHSYSTVTKKTNSCQNCQWHHVSICGKLPGWAKRPIKQQRTGRSGDAWSPTEENRCFLSLLLYLTSVFDLIINVMWQNKDPMFSLPVQKI